MIGILEVAAKIAADKDHVEELAATLAASKEAGQVAGALSGVSVDRSAAQMQQAADAIEEAESLQAALAGGLQKARWAGDAGGPWHYGPGVAAFMAELRTANAARNRRRTTLPSRP
jgi:hypothetical protein